MRLIKNMCVIFLVFTLLNTVSAQQSKPDFTVPKLKKAPVIDGKIDEWNGFTSVKMSKPNVDDLKVESANFAWDDKKLYFTVKVMDRKIVNDNSLERLAAADSVELRMLSGGGNNLCKIVIAPSSKDGKPALNIFTKDLKTNTKKLILSTTENNRDKGIEWSLTKNDESWTTEAAIPFSLLGIKPQEAIKIPFVMIVWDRDKTDVNEWKEWHKRSESSNQKAKPETWPSLLLSATGPLKTIESKPLKVTVQRHRPCNLFTPDKNVEFETTIKGGITGKGTLSAKLTDGFGTNILSKDFPFDHNAGNPTKLQLDLGKLPRGYYELNYTSSIQDKDTKSPEVSGKSTLGVMEFTDLSATDFLKKDRRFGMKWWGGVIDKPETLNMMQDLGLQWTRDIHTGVPKLLDNAPKMNVVIKVERFPKEIYDEARYGPLPEWEKKYGRGAWTLKTLPKKAAYQKWLKEGLDKIPQNQKVFEIWNEPWDKMSPEDFSQICQWIVDVILKDRPDAIIGPNLLGNMSDYQYDAKVINAGGMKGMKMVCLHPYAGSEDRAWLRKYRQWISEKTGTPIDIYVTEYGSHSTPKGPAKRSEFEQARRVVTQSLALYAEDVKALIPHWVGQSERNPTYIEDWFGFIRRNQEAKPALIAHANLARLIDGGKYIGDLWFGTGVGASMYQKEGNNVLALWTLGDDQEIEVATIANDLVLVDMFGTEKMVKPEGGLLRIKVGKGVQYLLGLGEESAKLASSELRPDRFPKPEKPPRASRTALKFKAKPTMDGQLKEWDGMTQISIMNPKVNGDDASAMGWLAWDEKYLYLAVDVRDNEVLNTRPRAKLYQQDSIELFVSAEPRDENPGYGPNDYQFFITPSSGEGKSIFGRVAERSAGIITDVKDAKFFCGKANNGWTAEVAIPWSAFPNFQPEKGAKLALEMRINDADTSHERWKLDPIDTHMNTENPTMWSLLILE